MYEIVTEAAVNELGNNGEHVRAEEIDRNQLRQAYRVEGCGIFIIKYMIYYGMRKNL